MGDEATAIIDLPPIRAIRGQNPVGVHRFSVFPYLPKKPAEAVTPTFPAPLNAQNFLLPPPLPLRVLCELCG